MVTRHIILGSLFLLTACDYLTANPHPKSLSQDPNIQVTANPRPKSLPQDPIIQVYFNQNQAQGANFTDPYRNIPRPGDNLEQIIIDTIHNARSTVDIAVQELRLPRLAQELATLKQKGIRVRIILENNYSRPLSELTTSEVDRLDERDGNSYRDYFAFIDGNEDEKLSSEEIAQRDALVILKNANIPIIDDTADRSKGNGLMHHKFIVVDGTTVIISSANFTLSDTVGDYRNPQSRGNANHLLKIKSSKLAEVLTGEFDIMWREHRFGIDKPKRVPSRIQLGQTGITVKFSPNSVRTPWNSTSNGLIERTLNTATKSVDLALFVFSEQKLSDALENRHLKGVTVRALIDPNFAFRNYSEGLDMMGVAIADNCRYEKNNHPWHKSIETVGVPNLPQGDKLHHKFALIDDNLVITGSHNWSAAANQQNDETLLILKNPIIAAHFKREFERLYQTASLGVPQYLQNDIKQEQKKCKN